MVKTSIIILTYNSAEYIEKLIKSVHEFNKGDDFEILIVDNASSDKTLQIAKKAGSKVKIFETGVNLGFAAGINAGARQAKGAYLLFVNPDAVWAEGSIHDFFKVFQRNEKIGIVGGKLLDKSGRSEKNAGKFYGFWGSVLLSLGLDETLGVRLSPEKIRKVDFVSGGFMMVPSSIFKKLSGFDEKFFMYIEDMELSFRAKKAGILTYFTPLPALIHIAQGSSNRSFAIRNIFHGILYFHKKHGSILSYLLIKILLGIKANLLVIVGKLINNRYLIDTYSNVI